MPQSGQRQLCAEAFKVGEKNVFHEDILRNMQDVLSRLKANIIRIEKAIPESRARTSNEEIKRMQESHINKLMGTLDLIKTLQDDAAQKRAELLQRGVTLLPTDPIASVIYTSFIENSGEKPQWQPYVSRLHSDRERLIILFKKFRVDKVVKGDVLKLEFHSSRLMLTVQPLNSSSLVAEDENTSPIEEGNIMLWLGYYMVHVEPHESTKKSYVVQAYYKVLSQKRERVSRGNQTTAEKPQILFLV